MSIEKNLVFIFPLLPVLTELKNHFEENSDFVIYEMDNLVEYKQLIGILEHVITFSSDMKKTSRYLQENKQFITGSQSLNIAVTKTTIPPHTFGKLQKFGLNEVHKDNVTFKSLEHKVNNFFNRFDAKKEQDQVEAQKAAMSTDVLIMNKENKDSNVIDTESKQRVERMASMDEDSSELKRKKVDLRGLSIGSGSGPGVMTGKINNSFNPAMGVLRKKELKGLNLPELTNSLKKGRGFTPVDPDRSYKKRGQFQAVDRDLQRKKLNIPDLLDGLKNKRKSFTPVDRELKRKKGLLLDPQNDPKKRKKLNLPDMIDGKPKSKLKLEEQKNELKRKKITPVQRELKKKDGRLDLRPPDQELKRKKLREDEENKKKKESGIIDLPGVQREIERKPNDVIGKEAKKKKGNLDLPGVEREIEWNKKKEDEEQKKKKNNKFEEIEIERGSGKNKSDILEKNYNSKTSNFTEIEKDSSRKDAGFEEIGISRDGIKAIKSDTEKEDYEKVFSYDKGPKDLGEQTIDYSSFSEETKAGKREEQKEKERLRHKAIADKLAQTPEIKYYYPSTKSIENLVHIESFLINPKMESSQYLKFIHFMLYKRFKALITFFSYRSSKFQLLYSSHLTEDLSIIKVEDNEKYVEGLKEGLKETQIPTWSDETYQVELNQFIYPYFQDGVLLGHAIGHFPDSIFTHEDAQQVEMYLMCAKSVYLQIQKDGP